MEETCFFFLRQRAVHVFFLVFWRGDIIMICGCIEVGNLWTSGKHLPKRIVCFIQSIFDRPGSELEVLRGAQESLSEVARLG